MYWHMRMSQSVGLALQYGYLDTLVGNTIDNRGYLLVYMYVCVDICVSFCTLTLTFLCLLCGLPLPIPPLTKPLSLVITYHSRKLFTPPHQVVSEWYKAHLGLKNLLLDSTLCSNSLEIHVFFEVTNNVKANGYYGIEQFTRRNKKNLCLYNSYECLLSKVTGNSDSQRLQKITVLRELM